MRNFYKIVFSCLFFFSIGNVIAWEGMPTPQLRVEGRFLKDPHGNIVNLHGFGQTYSPWFNEEGKIWNNYNVSGCLTYNKGLIDKILAAGWKMNFMRLHMDPYWSNQPGCTPDYHEAHNCFNETRFKTYLNQVFVPMAEYAISKGLYVVMRPPGVSPDKIEIGDDYNEYLKKVWNIVSQHPKLKNNPAVMFELANEPITILGPDGDYGNNSQGHFDNHKIYMQSIVDVIRANDCNNILWIPGLGWQAKYRGFAVNPVEGENIGYAVHVYPGWFGSQDGGNTSTINGYDGFKQAWDEEIKPVSDFAPIMVTEMDWAEEKYNASWGKAITGVAGGKGFGANFKKIMDETGNVSWLIFTSPHLLANFTGTPPAEGEEYTFLNDPEACPWPTHHWYQEYANDNYPRPEFEYRSHSDNGDGTFTNPVIFGDFPDPDVIRVDDVYYMVSTTMHTFPGATILKSNDLVNWEYCCNPLEKIESTSCYNLDGCDVYGHGQWASSLKYNNGTYYLLFNTLEEGSYLLTTNDIEGNWTKKKLNGSYYDPGLLFDDDGKIYVAHGINNITITQLNENFEEVTKQRVVSENELVKSGLEGSHLYKINGFYYIYATYGGWPAYQVSFRSNNIFGPYEQQSAYFNDANIHQGALIQTQTGEWWTMLFYDKGAYGRLPNLQPITWVDNWPVIGVNGKGVTTYKKPDVGKEYAVKSLPTNDNFRTYELGKQWGWNHNPDNSKWSLIERPDYLRLKTVNVTDSLHLAKNTLTQRIMGYPADLTHSYGTVALEINNMKEGDVAGLSVFQDPYAYIGVKMTGGQKLLVMYNNGSPQTGPAVSDSVIYLRAVANYNTSKASFYYSFNNETFTKLGTDSDMKFDLSVFMGNRFCLFNFATIETGGFVDFDWFSTEESFSEEKFFDNSFVGYSAEALTLTDILLENDTLNLVTGSTKSLTITARYADGRTEDISIGATFANSNPDVVRVVNGQIIALKDGDITITISYKGALGDAITKTLHVSSSTFPLISGLLNPSIYAQGTFNESTHTLITGQYGFGGWWYNNGVDLSDYKYLVAKLGADNKSGISFRVFDENNYWSGAAEYNFGSKRQVVVNLDNMVKAGTTTKLDKSHIYIVGFWSYGNSPVVIEKVFLSNSSEYGPTTAIDELEMNRKNEPAEVDVYTVTGAKIRSQVKRETATEGLPNGVYIIGREKVMIINKR